MAMKNQVQLITYPDSMGGNLSSLNEVLTAYFSGCFSGVHILPPFPSTSDRGFSPTTYFEIDPRFGSWQDIRLLSQNYEIMLDFMVNHISRRSVYFQDFQKHGRKSPYADMFITLDKIWEDGVPQPEDMDKIFMRRSNHPFIDVDIESDGTRERLWATFGDADWSEQIDLDVHSPITRDFIIELASFLSQMGVSAVRLDAVAYVIKKAGRSCFLVKPEFYDFMSWITAQFERVGVDLLLEVHTQPELQTEIANHGYRVYNFVLPILILHALLEGDGRALKTHLKATQYPQVTTLDCHDGIPVQPDIENILSVEQARRIVDVCVHRGANVSKIYSEKHLIDPTFDAHQINITYFSALNQDEDAYILARALQFFSPGIPQVYYVGLLAGENTPEDITKTGEKRAINRHNYTEAEIQQAVNKPVVGRLIKLIKFRNRYPAFDGRFAVQKTDAKTLRLSWSHENHQCILQADLESKKCRITYKKGDGSWITYFP